VISYSAGIRTLIFTSGEGTADDFFQTFTYSSGFHDGPENANIVSDAYMLEACGWFVHCSTHSFTQVESIIFIRKSRIPKPCLSLWGAFHELKGKRFWQTDKFDPGSLCIVV
jgi:hypothetical protein